MMYTYLNMFTVYTWLIVFFFLCVCVFKGGGREGWVSFLWKGKEAAAAKAMLPSSVVYADTPILVDFF